jgi:hypothetical protein
MTRLSCHTPAPHVPDATSHFGPLEIGLTYRILSGKSQGTSLVEMSRTLFGAGARQQGGAVEKRRDFLLLLQYYLLQENQTWMISHLQSLRALHN